eukprot:Gb_22772 [translate_table: standard]
MAHPLTNQKKNSVIFLHPMFQRRARKRTINNFALKREATYSIGNENKMSGDARTLCSQGQLKEALHILHVIDQCVNPSVYASLLQGCVNKRALQEGKLIHAHIIQTGFECEDIYLGTILLTLYAKCGRLVDARRVLDQMPRRNAVSWTVMITAYAKHGHGQEALALFYQMQRSGIQPDQFTFASVLPACASLAALEQGKDIHKEISRRGFESDIFVSNALLDMYTKCASIEKARHVFDKIPQRDMISWIAVISGYAQNGHINEAQKLFWKMPERNVVSWTTVIAAYAKHGFAEEALKLFYEMQRTGVRPNQFTFSSVLSACADLAALDEGKEIHEEINKRGIRANVFVGNALVDMYAKCGNIENARYVFDKMSKHDVVSFNAMIVGYAMHGCCKEALQLFEQMQHTGTNPNHATFVGVLSACCHGGLLDEGWQYFNSMSQYYQIAPTMAHYGCMVDLLGRDGRLDEARDFINRMPIKPDAIVWGSLLGACRVHTNIALGEYVAECLIELNPKDPAPYVLLANIYAAAGKWDDIEKMRKMMQDRKVKKKHGCSWIVVNKQVYAFTIGDISHLKMHKIYAKVGPLPTET